MTWSYTGNPASSPKDAVRFLIGDTDKCAELLQDDEIKYLLSQYNNAPMNAAIRACEVIMAKFSRMADESVGQVKISFSQKSKSYREMLANLRQRLVIEDSQFIAGGITYTDMQNTYADPNIVRPDFRKHMMENRQISPWVTGDYWNCFNGFPE